MFEADLGSVFRLYRAALARCWLPSLLLALAWGWMATLLDRRLGSSDDVFAWVAQVQALSWSGYFWWLSCAGGAISVFFYSAMVADIYAVATGGATPLAVGLYAALRALPGAHVRLAHFSGGHHDRDAVFRGARRIFMGHVAVVAGGARGRAQWPTAGLEPELATDAGLLVANLGADHGGEHRVVPAHHGF